MAASWGLAPPPISPVFLRGWQWGRPCPSDSASSCWCIYVNGCLGADWEAPPSLIVPATWLTCPEDAPTLVVWTSCTCYHRPPAPQPAQLAPESSESCWQELFGICIGIERPHPWVACEQGLCGLSSSAASPLKFWGQGSDTSFHLGASPDSKTPCVFWSHVLGPGLLAAAWQIWGLRIRMPQWLTSTFPVDQGFTCGWCSIFSYDASAGELRSTSGLQGLHSCITSRPVFSALCQCKGPSTRAMFPPFWWGRQLQILQILLNFYSKLQLHDCSPAFLIKNLPILFQFQVQTAVTQLQSSYPNSKSSNVLPASTPNCSCATAVQLFQLWTPWFLPQF